jgi:DNA-binding beta-propeller fold protein YncE
VTLPGVTGNAGIDYIAVDDAHGKVWVPSSAAGTVFIIDTSTKNVARLDGFEHTERDAGNGRKRVVGPNAVSIGGDFAYVGDRANNEICVVDAAKIEKKKCLKLPTSTDGVAYVRSAKEVWVTTPRDKSLTVLDASKPGALEKKTVVKTDGATEGYAVDEDHGLFFTNLEDKDATLVVDVKTHAVTATWKPSCGAEGPRGLAYDAKHRFVVVACTDHLQVLDAGHDGAALGRLETGAGVDNIDVVEGNVYAASGKTAKITVASIDDKGQLAVVATGATSDGARNAVADAKGTAYVADSPGARIFVMSR